MVRPLCGVATCRSSVARGESWRGCWGPRFFFSAGFTSRATLHASRGSRDRSVAWKRPLLRRRWLASLLISLLLGYQGKRSARRCQARCGCPRQEEGRRQAGEADQVRAAVPFFFFPRGVFGPSHAVTCRPTIEERREKNPMRAIRIEKLCLNICVGESGDKLTRAGKVLEALTRQKPVTVSSSC
jgi:hypothetical protein